MTKSVGSEVISVDQCFLFMVRWKKACTDEVNGDGRVY